MLTQRTFRACRTDGSSALPLQNASNRVLLGRPLGRVARPSLKVHAAGDVDDTEARFSRFIRQRQQQQQRDGNANSSGLNGNTPPPSPVFDYREVTPPAMPTQTTNEPRGQADLGPISNGMPIAFGGLSIISGLLALSCLVFPRPVLELALHEELMGLVSRFGMAGGDITLLRAAGATLIMSSAVEYCLMDAAFAGRLSSVTYQRLMWACSLKGVLYMAVLAADFGVWQFMEPLVLFNYPLLAIASTGLNLQALTQLNGGQLALPSPDLLPVTAKPTTLLGWAYTGLAGMFVATAVGAMLPGMWLDSIGRSTGITALLEGCVASGLVVAAVAAFGLRDAADRGRLGASTFKRLNLGMATFLFASQLVIISALLSDQIGPQSQPYALVLLGGSVAGCGLTANQFAIAHSNSKRK